MSDKESSDDEWEVVDIVHTTTKSLESTKNKAAKKEDVDKLAQEIAAQLNLKRTEDSQQLLILEQKMKQQQQMSEKQLEAIQYQLSQITKLTQQTQQQQKKIEQQRALIEQQQKQQFMEQQARIESLSEHQMQTQQHLSVAHDEIKNTKNIAIETQKQQQQHKLQQELQRQLEQQQLYQQQLQQMQQHHHNNYYNPLQPQMSDFSDPSFSLLPQQNNSGPNAVNTAVNNNNGWLPSIFTFGANNNNNAKNNIDKNQQFVHTMNDQDDSKANICVDHDRDDDDDVVLNWANDYGTNPLIDNPALLKTKDKVGVGAYQPQETRQCGWILQNTANVSIKFEAKLACIGGDSDEYGLKIKPEEIYELNLKPNEEIYILIEVIAPAIVGKYCAFYQLEIADDGNKVGEMLEIECEVQPEYNKKKESMIEQIIKMGFVRDRKKVVRALISNKWNLQQTVDSLIG
jgi:chemotaxis protein histidine kinase CheA